MSEVWRSGGRKKRGGGPGEGEGEEAGLESGTQGSGGKPGAGFVQVGHAPAQEQLAQTAAWLTCIPGQPCAVWIQPASRHK